MAIVLSPLACGALLQQLQETDTDRKLLRTIKCSKVYLNKYKKNIGEKQSIKLASPQNLERLWELLQKHDLRALTENRSVVVWYCDNLVNWLQSHLQLTQVQLR